MAQAKPTDGPENPDNPFQTAEDPRRLRRENERLERENEILSKASVPLQSPAVGDAPRMAIARRRPRRAACATRIIARGMWIGYT